MGISYSSGLPENDLINQIFFLGKCTKNEATEQGLNFYEWCSLLPLNQYYNATCTKVGESGDDKACSYGILFTSDQEVSFLERCDVGTKIVENTSNRTLGEGLYEKIQSNCVYWNLGRPLPWWLLLMIILVIVIAIAILAALLWTYWIKKRWNAAQKAGSTLTSRWTSSPVSEAGPSSMVASSRKASPVRATSIRTPSSRSYAKTQRSRSLSTGGRSRR